MESVVAEKFQAIVYLGYANSRMKDFYDILFLAENNRFTLKDLKTAIETTFNQRETKIENRFFIYDKAFIEEKDRFWKAFLRKIQSEMMPDFSQIMERIKFFLEPVLTTEDKSSPLVWNAHQWRWE